jgi:hypothetical protein
MTPDMNPDPESDPCYKITDLYLEGQLITGTNPAGSGFGTLLQANKYGRFLKQLNFFYINTCADVEKLTPRTNLDLDP